ncbi:putative argininosuccinate synthetase [Danaus plexippus plexippus]|uniref:Argininosuccinate synthase n=1 Tax=Danaus plexippus plexippus TaxID=278856 RepID=A0A212FC20_DANPL|nr:putative argininosuccinate synthetase [Danaus plexippus plexippus]
MSKDLVILAYSGGLDTSCILKWLIQKNYDVVCYMADIGQDEDFEKARQKAKLIGAKDVIIEDLRNDFVSNYMFPAIQMGLVYESRYYLGTSVARPCISVGIVNAAKKLGAKYISHGATGKGNDQVRFELSVYSLWPEGKVIAPWRQPEFFNRFQGRKDLIEFAKQENIPVSATPKAPWSTDENIMHISYESGVLEDPTAEPPSGIYKMTRDLNQAEDYPSTMDITFEKGLPVSVKIPSGQEKALIINDPLNLVRTLNKLGGQHGVGRIDIVENRFLGLKSRGLYETPAGTILHVAHLDLETYALDKEVLRLKKYLQEKMSDFVYNGFWFAPEARYTRKCLELSQESVSGTVTVQVFKGNVIVLARKSAKSLYNQELVSMDIAGGFSPEDSTGFININAVRLKEYARFAGGQEF